MQVFPRHTKRIALAAATFALSWTPPANAIIDSVTGCRTPASGPVAVYAGGRAGNYVVAGGGVDLATGVEDTGVAGVTVRLGERKHGTGSTIEVQITASASARHGDQGRVRLKYPLGEDSFPIKVVQRMTVTSISIEDVRPTDGRYILDLNRDYTLVFRGTNAEHYEAPGDLPGLFNNVRSSFLSRSGDTVRLRIRSGTKRGYTIEPSNLRGDGCYALRMEGSASARVFFGFDPSENRPPAPGAGVPPPPPVRPPTTGGATQTNLLPARLFPERPLLRKINTLSATMVPIALCGNLGNDEEGDRPLPDFEWGVSNTDFEVTTPFQVQLVNGATGATLATQTVPGIPRGDLRTFRNWPGRPASVRLVRVVARLLKDYDNAPGCYVAKSAASSVTLDPRPILIRVDTGSAVPEGSRENDNELRID